MYPSQTDPSHTDCAVMNGAGQVSLRRRFGMRSLRREHSRWRRVPPRQDVAPAAPPPSSSSTRIRPEIVQVRDDTMRDAGPGSVVVLVYGHASVREQEGRLCAPRRDLRIALRVTTLGGRRVACARVRALPAGRWRVH